MFYCLALHLFYIHSFLIVDCKLVGSPVVVSFHPFRSRTISGIKRMLKRSFLISLSYAFFLKFIGKF